MGNDAPPRQEAVSRPRSLPRGSVWEPWTEGAMWATLGVVMRHPLGQNVAQVPFVQRNNPIEPPASESADQPFAIGIRLRCARRRAQHRERKRLAHPRFGIATQRAEATLEDADRVSRRSAVFFHAAHGLPGDAIVAVVQAADTLAFEYSVQNRAPFMLGCLVRCRR